MIKLQNALYISLVIFATFIILLDILKLAPVFWGIVAIIVLFKVLVAISKDVTKDYLEELAKVKEVIKGYQEMLKKDGLSTKFLHSIKKHLQDAKDLEFKITYNLEINDHELSVILATYKAACSFVELREQSNTFSDLHEEFLKKIS